MRKHFKKVPIVSALPIRRVDVNNYEYVTDGNRLAVRRSRLQAMTYVSLTLKYRPVQSRDRIRIVQSTAQNSSQIGAVAGSLPV